MKKQFQLIISILVIMFALAGCDKETQEQHPTKEHQVNEQTSGEVIIKQGTNFIEEVKFNQENEQTFLLDADLTLDKGVVRFRGISIVIDGGEDRAKVQMLSNAGFAFERSGSSLELQIKNVDFINKKVAGGTRSESYIHSTATNVVYKNCTFSGGVAVFGNAKFVNCTFDETDSLRYCIFIDNEYGNHDAMTIELENCTFEGHSMAYGLVKVADDSRVGATLKIKDCQFSNILNKAAVYVNGRTVVMTEGTNTYTNCTIGAILAKGNSCVLNNEAMTEGQSYEQ